MCCLLWRQHSGLAGDIVSVAGPVRRPRKAPGPRTRAPCWSRFGQNAPPAGYGLQSAAQASAERDEIAAWAKGRPAESSGGAAAAGGLIALINDGDSITIDANQLLLQLNVSDEEIAIRRASWVAPKPRYTRGVQAKFAFNASTASKGAVLDNY